MTRIRIGLIEEKGFSELHHVPGQGQKVSLDGAGNHRQSIENAEIEGEKIEPAQKQMQDQKPRKGAVVHQIQIVKPRRHPILHGEKEEGIGSAAHAASKGFSSHFPFQKLNAVLPCDHKKHEGIDQKCDLSKIS